MRTVIKFVSVLGLALLVAVPAAAQTRQQRGQFGGRGGPATLLQNEGVQKELQMDAGQIDKAKAAAQKIEERDRDARAKLRDLGEEERRQKQQELSRTAARETYAAVADILKPEQVKRLRQIDLQQRGYEAFTDVEVQKTLKLTDDQVKRIAAAVRDADEQRGKLFQRGAAGDFAEVRTKLDSLRKEATTKVTGLLKEDQRAAWKELTGTPFEVRFERRRPPQ